MLCDKREDTMTETVSPVTVEDLRAFADAWDRHDLDAIMSVFTDNCIFIAGWGERFEGLRSCSAGSQTVL